MLKRDDVPPSARWAAADFIGNSGQTRPRYRSSLALVGLGCSIVVPASASRCSRVRMTRSHRLPQRLSATPNVAVGDPLGRYPCRGVPRVSEHRGCPSGRAGTHHV
jgi:hypothetical protein